MGLLMNAVRYPFINTRQGKSSMRALWKFVENAISPESSESYRTCLVTRRVMPGE
jgi:ribosomal protein L20